MSLDHSGLHHLAAVAELKQQEEEEEMMEVSAGPGLHQTEAVMMEVTGGLGGGDTPRSATPTNCHTLGPSCSAPAPLSPDSAITANQIEQGWPRTLPERPKARSLDGQTRSCAPKIPSDVSKAVLKRC